MLKSVVIFHQSAVGALFLYVLQFVAAEDI